MDALSTLLAELLDVAEQPEGWDGHDARRPSKTALIGAHRVLMEASRHTPLPVQVVPDVMGGVAFYWYGTERTSGGGHRLAASLKVDNDGDLFVSLVDRVTREVDVSEVSAAGLTTAFDRMMAFLGPAEARAAS
jgi:hypothetical protein